MKALSHWIPQSSYEKYTFDMQGYVISLFIIPALEELWWCHCLNKTTYIQASTHSRYVGAVLHSLTCLGPLPNSCHCKLTSTSWKVPTVCPIHPLQCVQVSETGLSHLWEGIVSSLGICSFLFLWWVSPCHRERWTFFRNIVGLTWLSMEFPNHRITKYGNHLSLIAVVCSIIKFSLVKPPVIWGILFIECGSLKTIGIFWVNRSVGSPKLCVPREVLAWWMADYSSFWLGPSVLLPASTKEKLQGAVLICL